VFVTSHFLCVTKVNLMDCMNFKIVLLKFGKAWRVFLPSIFVGL
jgi:hypothetical protein